MKKLFNLFLCVILFTAVSCSKDNEPIETSAQDLIVSINENPTNGDAVGMIEAAGDGTLSFSIISQTPIGALNINQTTGELTVGDENLFDFETNPVITANISVVGNANTATATATININNENELSIQDFAVNVDENPANGYSLGVVQAIGDGTLSYSIISQSPVGSLDINATTGELTVVNPNLFDFETNPVITANILVDNSGNTATATATINLNDIDEIVVQPLTVVMDENPTNGQVVGMLQATSSQSLTYTITYQNPAGAFNINSSTGELTVANAILFDFETNPNMLATVSIINSSSTSSVSVNALVNLNDVDETATIGDFRDGGVVFWVNPVDNNHGLVCAVSDYPGIWFWGCEMLDIQGANSSAVNTGEVNTNAIIAICTVTNAAAKIASVYVGPDLTGVNSFDDWFLPSKDALNEMYLNKTVINTIAIANGGEILYPQNTYWSSTQYDQGPSKAWSQYFGNGSQNKVSKITYNSIRVIRAF